MKPSMNPGPRKARVLPNFIPNRPWGAGRKNRAVKQGKVNWTRGSGSKESK